MVKKKEIVAISSHQSLISKHMLESYYSTIALRSNGDQALVPGLHIVVTVVKHACDYGPKKIL